MVFFEAHELQSQAHTNNIRVLSLEPSIFKSNTCAALLEPRPERVLLSLGTPLSSRGKRRVLSRTQNPSVLGSSSDARVIDSNVPGLGDNIRMMVSIMQTVWHVAHCGLCPKTPLHVPTSTSKALFVDGVFQGAEAIVEGPHQQHLGIVLRAQHIRIKLGRLNVPILSCT